MQMMPPWMIVLSAIAIIPFVLMSGGAIFLRLLLRARWLLASILMIYAYATPGEYIHGFPEAIAPTFEGVTAGSLQALRVVAMLGGLSMWLATSTREEIISGISQLLASLSVIGLYPERFSARLWLTLQYVENLPDNSLKQLRLSGWNLEAFCGEFKSPTHMTLENRPLSGMEIVLLLAPLFLCWLIV